MSRYLPDFAGAFCLVIFLVSLVAQRDIIFGDGDSFWHIKAGSVMLEQQSLIDNDIFSHTAFGTPWTAHEWLSEIVMAGVHKVAGLEGILCFFLLIVALAFWMLFKITEKYAHQWVTLGCVSLAWIFAQSHLAARPHLFTWLFMLITLAILTSGGKWLYWLPLVMVVWANLHGGFILGLVLQIIFIVGAVLETHLSIKKPWKDALRQQKLPALVLLLSLITLGLNPFGYELLAFPFQVSKGVFSEVIREWRAPDLQGMWYFRLYLVAFVLLITLAKRSATWTERLLIVFFLNAAFTHIRHVSLMLMALAPFTARMLDSCFDRVRHKAAKHEESKQLQLSAKSGPIATLVIALALIISGSIDHRSLHFLTPQKIFSVETQQLNQLVAYLEEDQPPGNMFNEYVLGGYLLYALSPPPKVFIDGRADMYGEQILTDYNSIKSSCSKRQELLDKYAIDWVVFETSSDLMMDLRKSGLWQTTFENDGYEVVTRVDSSDASR